MKIELGVYRHMLTRDYYNFARQAGCSHVMVHLAKLAAELPAAGHADK